MDVKARKKSALQARKVFNVNMLVLGLSMFSFALIHLYGINLQIDILYIPIHVVAILAVYFFYWKTKSNSIFNQILVEV